MTADAEILVRLERIEALLEKMADAQPIELPEPSGRRVGKYTQEQWQAIVRNPEILREMSKRDTSRRRKKMLASGRPNEAHS